MITRKLEETIQYIRARSTLRAKIGFVLGSGLSGFASQVEADCEIPYKEIPHFAPSTVEGHPGKLVLGNLEGIPVVLMLGRLHAYEGLTFQQVVYPIRALASLGTEFLTVTNAAGGLNKKMRAGDFMLIRDQMNFTGDNPLRGPNWAGGPRFVDMTEPYDSVLTRQLKAALVKEKVRHHEGVYVGVLGPAYETAAEIRFYARCGGGAVGMSTVAEVIAARHAGLRVAGLSCITNLGTGLSKSRLNHEEVKEAAQEAEARFNRVLVRYTKSLKTMLG
jgi:purine-nucleoside phosphorylase